MSEWIQVGNLDDIPSRGARCVTTPSGRIAIFRTSDDQVFALENRCPHRDGPLADGMVHGHSVTCPLHNWVISLETGEAQGADEGRVPTIPVRVENGRILLSSEALHQVAAE